MTRFDNDFLKLALPIDGRMDGRVSGFSFSVETWWNHGASVVCLFVCVCVRLMLLFVLIGCGWCHEMFETTSRDNGGSRWWGPWERWLLVRQDPTIVCFLCLFWFFRRDVGDATTMMCCTPQHDLTEWRKGSERWTDIHHDGKIPFFGKIVPIGGLFLSITTKQV